MKRILLGAAAALILSAPAIAATSFPAPAPHLTRITAVGANTYTPHTSEVIVRKACASGGGGAGGQGSANTAGGGGGGAGHCLKDWPLAVTPGGALTVNIPDGGASGAIGAVGTAGTDPTITGALSSFPSSGIPVGSGGLQGASSVGGVGGASGNTAGGAAATIGGFPGVAATFPSASLCPGGSGGGGGSAASTGGSGGGVLAFGFAAGSGSASGGGGGGSCLGPNTAPPAAGVAGTDAPVNTSVGGPGGGANAHGGKGSSGLVELEETY